VQYKEGFWWPDTTREEIRRLILDTVTDAMYAIDYVKERKCCVQAGGNVGCWPKWLSYQFEEVWTFEPDEENWACLVCNVLETNVHKYKAGLGAKRGKMGMRLSPKNIGAHRLEGTGTVKVMTIDNLRLKACNALFLDVEGYELPVLKGSTHTLGRHHPVVMVEDRGLGAKTKNGGIKEIGQFLSGWGYEEVARIHYDVVFA
jgi:FkbM family methyltransferase